MPFIQPSGDIRNSYICMSKQRGPDIGVGIATVQVIVIARRLEKITWGVSAAGEGQVCSKPWSTPVFRSQRNEDEPTKEIEKVENQEKMVSPNPREESISRRKELIILSVTPGKSSKMIDCWI